jgi:general secretion pathway protein A
MSYLDFYHLQLEPFSNAPNERFYYNSAQHARALTRMMYVAETMKGLAVVVGDIGTGKTTLARKMLDNLPEEAYESALLVILHSEITSEWLLKKIATQLGIERPATEKIQIIAQLYRRLLQLHEGGKRAVVLIDEAQMLNTREIMEEFRGLLNLEVTANKLITFIFFGLPELEKNLALDPPLLQRVAMKIRLSTLGEEATRSYVLHRLAVAGAREPLFTDDALASIHRYSQGFPRKINVLCDNALFQGFLMRRRVVDSSMVEEMAGDLSFGPESEAEKIIPSFNIPPEWATGENPFPGMGGQPFPPAAPAVAAPPVARPAQCEPAAGTAAGGAEDVDSRFERFFNETFHEK